MTDSNKVKDLSKKLEKIVKAIEKRFGENEILVGSQSGVLKVDTIPTGSLLLDVATGIGGIPLGYIVEFFGNESSGKTTLALSVLGQAQKRGMLTAFIDAEQTLSPDWAKVLGVDIDNLLISQPDTIEKGLEIAKLLIENGVQLIVFDSVAAAPTVAEKEGNVGDAVIGQKARVMSKFTSSILSTLRQNKATIIFINQIREKVGVMFGNPETTPGGKALKFNASLRIKLSKKDVREGGAGSDKIGAEITAEIVKNKLAPPFKKATLKLIYGKGFDYTSELAQAALDSLVAAKESRLTIVVPGYKGGMKYKGMPAFKEAVETDKELQEYLKDTIMKVLRKEIEPPAKEVAEQYSASAKKVDDGEEE